MVNIYIQVCVLWGKGAFWVISLMAKVDEIMCKL